MKNIPSLLLATALLLTQGCSDSSDNLVFDDGAQTAFSAELRRTEFGIPHVRADDWAGLGYGYGYAYAQDNFCVTMREIVMAGGRSAELMGEAEGNVDLDLYFRYLNGSKEEFSAEFLDALPDDIKDLVNGFATGMNRYLRETGVDNLPEGDAGCRSANWVFEIDAVDLYQYLRRIGLGASSDQGLIRDAVIAVQGPPDGMIDPMPAPVSAQSVAAPDADAWRAAAAEFRPDKRGSNAIAVGRDLTQNGSGLLLGNPHQPWQGSGRWYEVHLTIPGVYDVAGASLQGLPWIGIGFNKDLAWTHTVAFSTRFSLYELQLNPDNPLEYEYDGEFREITAETVSVQVLLEDGSFETREKTFYESQFGPILDLGGVDPLLGGWPLFNGNLMTFRDANLLTGLRSGTQYVEKAQATNMDEFTDALRSIGNPVFHEFAADRNGDVFYGEVAAIPHITTDKLNTCTSGVGRLISPLTNNAIISLDGSRSACEWGEDPDSPPDSNVFGFDARPTIRTTDYVGNSNNSYWLSDANNPLVGFPVTMGWLGAENQQQFLRTRLTHLMVEDRRNGTDDLSPTPGFTLQNLQDLMYNNRVHGAEVALDDTLQICADYIAALPDTGGISFEEQALNEACAALSNWDRRVDLDSRGAQVFKEYWGGIRNEIGGDFTNVVDDNEFWLVDFDPAQPLTTPRGIDAGIESNRDLVISQLLRAYTRLTDAGVALDAPWGEIHYLERNQIRVPIHGGEGTMGVFGAVSTSLQPGGYINPRQGNSYIQTVTWDESDCPIADTILTHSQSTDPASPFYGDQSEVYSRKEWVRFPFCEEDIEAAQIGETLILQE